MIIELTETHFYLGIGLGVAGLALLGLIAYQLRALRGQTISIRLNIGHIVDVMGLMKNGIADVFTSFAQEINKNSNREMELYEQIKNGLNNIGEHFEQTKKMEEPRPVEA